jgi:hypothetical protein
MAILHNDKDLNAATSGTGPSHDTQGHGYHALFTIWSAGVSAGQVLLEGMGFIGLLWRARRRGLERIDMANVDSKKVVRKDAGLAADLGNDAASRLAAMKPGESINFMNEQPEKVVSQTAADISERPQPVFDYGTGQGRVQSTHQYVSRPSVPASP